MSEQFKHVSVLLEESIDGLNIKPDGIYIDAPLVVAAIAEPSCPS